MLRFPKLLLLAGALFALVLPSTASAAKKCNPVKNPYAGTRYEGTDLSRILATRVTCKGARRVAKRAHHKGLGLTPPPSGIRRYTWNGWSVTGNLRGDHDRYLATKGGQRVRWRF